MTLASLNSNIFKCVEAIAMTDIAELSNCAMVRRIDVGEALELLEGEPVKPVEGGIRQKFRACRDSREGWITVNGSQGTVFVKAAPKHYLLTQAAPVHAGIDAASAVVRVMMPGEAFNAFEDPREVVGGDRRTIYRARTTTDNLEGWVASGMEDEVRSWSSRYKVLKTVPLTRGFAANEAAEVIEVVRLLDPNELVDVTENPTEDPSTGQLRIRCIAVRDKAVGWTNVREGGIGMQSLLVRPAEKEDSDKMPESSAKSSTAPPVVPSEAPEIRGRKRTAEVAHLPSPQFNEDIAPPVHPPRPRGKGGYGWSGKGYGQKRHKGNAPNDY